MILSMIYILLEGDSPMDMIIYPHITLALDLLMNSMMEILRFIITVFLEVTTQY